MAHIIGHHGGMETQLDEATRRSFDDIRRHHTRLEEANEARDATIEDHETRIGDAETRLDTLEAVVPWTKMTYESGFVDYDTDESDYHGWYYRKIGDRVELRGLAGTGLSNAVAAYEPWAILPVGFRPPKIQILNAQVYDTGITSTRSIGGRCNIDPNGSISYGEPLPSSGTYLHWMSLDGLSFSVTP